VRAQGPGEGIVRDGEVLVPSGNWQPRLYGVHQVECWVASDERQVGYSGRCHEM
jgi:hypothetical protein